MCGPWYGESVKKPVSRANVTALHNLHCGTISDDMHALEHSVHVRATTVGAAALTQDALRAVVLA